MASAAQQAGALSTQVLDQQQRLTEQEQQLAQSAAQARADSQTLAAERQRAAHQAETLQSSLAGAERRAEEADASLVALQRRLDEVSAEQQVGRYRSLSGVWQHLWRCKLMGDCVPSCRLGLAKMCTGRLCHRPGRLAGYATAAAMQMAPQVLLTQSRPWETWLVWFCQGASAWPACEPPCLKQ